MTRKAILLAGPTASGKSSLALKMAAQYDAEIINVDSMQVYSDLRIVTARPTNEQTRQVPHHLYGFVDAGCHYSVGHYLRDVESLLEQLQRSGKSMIFTGGTGLYFNALEQSLSSIPPIDPKIEKALLSRLEQEGLQPLWQELQNVDPNWAHKISSNDQQRIVRGLTVFLSSGKRLSLFHEQERQGKSAMLDDFDVIERYLIWPDRDRLRARISKRVDAMLKNGALEEVRALLARKLEEKSSILKAIGVQELGAALAGNMKVEDAVEAMRLRTAQYAKRQMTWFRNQAKTWRRLDEEGTAIDHQPF